MVWMYQLNQTECYNLFLSWAVLGKEPTITKTSEHSERFPKLSLSLYYIR